MDLVSHLNARSAAQHRAVRRVRGEESLLVDGTYLFPDVMLYQDDDAAAALQGWELKMPDTPIGDPVFRENAERKAAAYGLDSYLLWNVCAARLYVRGGDGQPYAMVRSWDDLADLTTREQVALSESRWKLLADEILEALNLMFEEGAVEPRRFLDAYRSGGLTGLILDNAGLARDALDAGARKDADLHDEISLWWMQVKREYGDADPHRTLAQANLINWIGKLLFLHLLRTRDVRAARVTARDGSSASDFLVGLEALSAECNFWTIFRPGAGQHLLPDRAWAQLKELDRFLADHRLGAVDQRQLSELLEATVDIGVRKTRGQYTTPSPLARLLVRLTLRNAEARFLDPCCGSGTIARAAQELKLARGVGEVDVAKTVWASDVDPHALQIASFAIARPQAMGEVQHVFAHDAFDLDPAGRVLLRDPNTGAEVKIKIGRFGAVVCNLPFVAQDGRERYAPQIGRVNARLAETPGGRLLSGRADVLAYLAVHLGGMVEPGGRLGIVLSNAWLGAEWGGEMLDALGADFDLRLVVTSGAGRWFANADVVANLLVFERRADRAEAGGPAETRFVVLKRRIEDLDEGVVVDEIAAAITVGRGHDDLVSVRTRTRADLAAFSRRGLGANAAFVDVGWVNALPLRAVRDQYKVVRGNRRGWNQFFYPRQDHTIEENYLVPMLKNLRGTAGLTATPNAVAFCCERSEAELDALGHDGALDWIRRHAAEKTSSGIPQCEARLADAPPGGHWYTMRPAPLADLVLPINPNLRLFLPGLDVPALIDQRLSGLAAREGVSRRLGRALLNSAVGMYFLEGIGFGRGLGVLDLSATRVRDNLFMLDASALSGGAVERILSSYERLAQRPVMEVADELEQPDRRAFDEAVLDGFGSSVGADRIYAALLELVSIRLAAVT